MTSTRWGRFRPYLLFGPMPLLVLLVLTNQAMPGPKPVFYLIAAIHAAAPLHDIGKLAIPECLLQKPGPLSPEEYELVKRPIDILCGGPAVRAAIEAGESPRKLARGWKKELAAFRRRRARYLLY